MLVQNGTVKREKALLTDLEQKDVEKVKGCLEGIMKNKKYKLYTPAMELKVCKHC